jgi:hypothetical protein
MLQYRHRLTLGGFLFAMFVSLSAIPSAHAQSTGTPTALPEAAPTASAQRASNDNLISAFLGLGYAYIDSGFGVGARYQKIVAPNGVIKTGPVHDELGFEGGVDYYRYDFGHNFGAVADGLTYNEVAITFGAVWNFWLLDDKLALYPKLDLAYRIGSFSGNSGTMTGYGGLWIQGTAGVVYRLSGVSLRAELGSGSLRLGAGFSFF